MFNVRHYFFLSVVFLSACSLQQNKSDSAPKTSQINATPPVSTPVVTTPPVDPNPLVSLADTSPSSSQSADLWERMRKGFSLPPAPAGRMQKELSFYSRYPSFMKDVSQRGSRYLYYVVDELEKRKMPMELALIPVVESAYDPKARSPGGAAGLWQMMDGTGRVLGLKRTQFYDGRHDVVASTDAALDYLQKLSRKFDGDWHLALAAYNSGELNVIAAIKRNKARGLPTDYWSLDLPSHTEVYIPKILAIKTIISTPEKYRVVLHPIPNKPYFAKVNISSQISLSAAATHSGVDFRDLQLLNPGYSRASADPQVSRSLLVPVNSAESFASSLNKANRDQLVVKPTTLPAKDSEAATGVATNNSAPSTSQQGNVGTKITHTIKKGDSLWTLSKRYKVSSDAIAQWNNLKPKSDMKLGRQLVIWSKG